MTTPSPTYDWEELDGSDVGMALDGQKRTSDDVEPTDLANFDFSEGVMVDDDQLFLHPFAGAPDDLSETKTTEEAGTSTESPAAPPGAGPEAMVIDQGHESITSLAKPPQIRSSLGNVPLIAPPPPLPDKHRMKASKTPRQAGVVYEDDDDDDDEDEEEEEEEEDASDVYEAPMNGVNLPLLEVQELQDDTERAWVRHYLAKWVKENGSYHGDQEATQRALAWARERCQRHLTKMAPSKRKRKPLKHFNYGLHVQGEVEDDDLSEEDDVCNECGKGGHLYCCAFCPCVFHLECLRPHQRPTSESDDEKWKCPLCVDAEQSDSGGDEEDEDFELDKELDALMVERELQDAQEWKADRDKQGKQAARKMQALVETLNELFDRERDDGWDVPHPDILRPLVSVDRTRLRFLLENGHPHLRAVVVDRLSIYMTALYALDTQTDDGVDDDDIAIDTAADVDQQDLADLENRLKGFEPSTKPEKNLKTIMGHIVGYVRGQLKNGGNPELVQRSLSLGDQLWNRDGFYTEDRKEALSLLRTHVIGTHLPRICKMAKEVIDSCPQLAHDPVSGVKSGSDSAKKNKATHSGTMTKDNKKKSKPAAGSNKKNDNNGPPAPFTMDDLKQSIPKVPDVKKAVLDKVLLPQASHGGSCGSEETMTTTKARAVLLSKPRHKLPADAEHTKWDTTPNATKMNKAFRALIDSEAFKETGTDGFVKNYIGWALWRPNPDVPEETWTLACVCPKYSDKGRSSGKRMLLVQKRCLTTLFPIQNKGRSQHLLDATEKVKDLVVKQFSAEKPTVEWKPSWSWMKKNEFQRTATAKKDGSHQDTKHLPVIDSRRLPQYITKSCKSVYAAICTQQGVSPKSTKKAQPEKDASPKPAATKPKPKPKKKKRKVEVYSSDSESEDEGDLRPSAAVIAAASSIVEEETDTDADAMMAVPDNRDLLACMPTEGTIIGTPISEINELLLFTNAYPVPNPDPGLEAHTWVLPSEMQSDPLPPPAQEPGPQTKKPAEPVVAPPPPVAPLPPAEEKDKQSPEEEGPSLQGSIEKEKRAKRKVADLVEKGRRQRRYGKEDKAEDGADEIQKQAPPAKKRKTRAKKKDKKEKEDKKTKTEEAPKSKRGKKRKAPAPEKSPEWIASKKPKQAAAAWTKDLPFKLHCFDTDTAPHPLLQRLLQLKRRVDELTATKVDDSLSSAFASLDLAGDVEACTKALQSFCKTHGQGPKILMLFLYLGLAIHCPAGLDPRGPLGPAATPDGKLPGESVAQEKEADIDDWDLFDDDGDDDAAGKEEKTTESALYAILGSNTNLPVSRLAGVALCLAERMRRNKPLKALYDRVSTAVIQPHLGEAVKSEDPEALGAALTTWLETDPVQAGLFLLAWQDMRPPIVHKDDA